jgi:hypothetical protein
MTAAERMRIINNAIERAERRGRTLRGLPIALVAALRVERRSPPSEEREQFGAALRQCLTESGCVPATARPGSVSGLRYEGTYAAMVSAITAHLLAGHVNGVDLQAIGDELERLQAGLDAFGDQIAAEVEAGV